MQDPPPHPRSKIDDPARPPYWLEVSDESWGPMGRISPKAEQTPKANSKFRAASEGEDKWPFFAIVAFLTIAVCFLILVLYLIEAFIAVFL